MDQKTVDIGPVQGTMRFVPNHALPATISSGRYAYGFREHFCGSSSFSKSTVNRSDSAANQ